MNDQQERLNSVNEFIQIIAICGRKFFRHKGNVSAMELDEQGRVWFIDDYTGHRIYTHYKHEWQSFTSGGTMKRLVEFFRDHIVSGDTLNPRYFEINKMWCSGHPWGYPHGDLAMLDREARRLGIIRPTTGDEDDE
ncbi:hypothetical protein [Alcanivorax jadensis]|uniref:hypothetical protein n=1 Tax=Alcanivorax jadensis TaxID=64988 RepID=UPI0023543BE2|nr:hypothetical protein [Alcanivorax jadensis]|tara:strand:- start:621 stop:1028 length:408 start_codon:yes stop_codon:yes gene_type:complete